MDEKLNFNTEGEPKNREELGDLLPILEVLEDLIGEDEHEKTYKDPRMNAFFAACRHLILYDERFRSMLDFVLYFRQERGRHTPPLYAINLTLRAVQHQARKMSFDDFVELSKTSAGWIEMVNRIYADADYHEEHDTDALEELEGHLTSLEVMTNVPSRYGGPKLWLALNRHRFKNEDGTQRPIRLLDLGPSVGAGIRALIGNKLNESIEVHQVITDAGGLNPRAESHEPLTRYINGKLSEVIEFGPCAGLDIASVEEKGAESMASFLGGTREYVKSNFYPSELAEYHKVVQDFDEALDLKLDNYRQYVADASDPDSINEARTKLPSEEFDVVTILTVLNQHTNEEIAQIIENAKSLLSKDGVIIIQDFVAVDPAAPNSLRFFPKWGAYTYRTIVIERDTSDKKQFKIYEVFWWRNGRAKEVIIAPTAQNYYSDIAIEED